MARTKQPVKSTGGGKAPRKQLATREAAARAVATLPPVAAATLPPEQDNNQEEEEATNIKTKMTVHSRSTARKKRRAERTSDATVPLLLPSKKKKKLTSSTSKDHSNKMKGENTTTGSTKNIAHQKHEDASILELGPIFSNICSYVDYMTKVTTLRPVSKKWTNLINKDLYNKCRDDIPRLCEKYDASKEMVQRASKLLSFREGCSEKYENRDQFFQYMLEKHSTNIDDMLAYVKNRTVVQKIIDNLGHTNGIVNLHDDFNFKDTSDHSDMVHEWKLEFEHYGEDDTSADKSRAIWKTFFSKDSSFREIDSISPYRSYSGFNERKYDKEIRSLNELKDVLFGLLVNARSVQYHKVVFHNSCWPDGQLSMQYEHCGDDLEFGEAHFEAALSILMPDGTKFEVTMKSKRTRRCRLDW